MYTVGPIFIGSGVSVSKKEVVFSKKEVTFYDKNKMFAYLYENNLIDTYTKYALDSGYGLEDFIRRYIPVESAKSWVLRTLPMRSFKNLHNPQNVSLFIRDGRGKVYVPGSSIKGMFRTAILSGMLYDIRQALDGNVAESRDFIKKFDRNVLSEIKNIIQEIEILLNRIDEKDSDKKISECFHKLETKLFHEPIHPESKTDDLVNSIMRGLRILDSEEVSEKKLEIYQKYDISINKNEKGLPLYRECIKPKSTIHFSLEIDASIFPYTIEDVWRWMELHYEKVLKEYKTTFTKAFKEPSIIKRIPHYPFTVKENKEKYGKAIYSYLGGGAGFQTKTLIYSMFPKEKAVKLVSQILRRKFPKHKHELDAKKGISPRTIKLAKHDDTNFQMGFVALRFCKIKQPGV